MLQQRHRARLASHIIQDRAAQIGLEAQADPLRLQFHRAA